MRCNCSYCAKLGIVHSLRIETEQLLVTQGLELISEYLFCDKVVKHQFCGHCGVYVFYTGDYCKVNLGCLKELDLGSIQVTDYNGATL